MCESAAKWRCKTYNALKNTRKLYKNKVTMCLCCWYCCCFMVCDESAVTFSVFPINNICVALERISCFYCDFVVILMVALTTEAETKEYANCLVCKKNELALLNLMPKRESWIDNEIPSKHHIKRSNYRLKKIKMRCLLLIIFDVKIRAWLIRK